MNYCNKLMLTIRDLCMYIIYYAYVMHIPWLGWSIVLVCTGTKNSRTKFLKICLQFGLTQCTDCDSLVMPRNCRMSTKKLIDLFEPHGMTNLYGEKKTVFSVWALNHRPQTYNSPSNIDLSSVKVLPCLTDAWRVATSYFVVAAQ